MSTQRKAYLAGGELGSLSAATFMIRDGGLPSENNSTLETVP